MTERGRKSRRTSPGLKYLLVLLMAALVIVSALLFAEPTRADRNVDGTLPVNETIVEELRSMEDEDVRQVVQKNDFRSREPLGVRVCVHLGIRVCGAVHCDVHRIGGEQH